MLLMELFALREDAATTCSGSIATVSAPLGAVQRRIPGDMFSAKYTTDSNLTPNTPDEYKKYKRKK